MLENLRRSGADKAELIVFEFPIYVDAPFAPRQDFANVSVGFETIETFFERPGIVSFD